MNYLRSPQIHLYQRVNIVVTTMSGGGFNPTHDIDISLQIFIWAFEDVLGTLSKEYLFIFLNNTDYSYHKFETKQLSNLILINKRYTRDQ